ncbi:MAG TPA: IclR family transcriptional regulator [Candidatus Hydrogenedentes bacterium]|nr:IclR family transcriptional regulator [Candidatus Hydrogenedentota bacterium]HPG68774.1 IclR family transcriptional regulator [Candidatus Hydrogenedentota bacterium]
MAAAKPTSYAKVPILDRALILMEHLLDHPRGLGMSEIANQLGFPKNSVYRILATLEKRGYVNRESDSKRYVLSRKLFSMAYSEPEEKSLMENAVDAMRDLRDEVKETVLITVLSGEESLVLEQMPGLYPFRFVVEPGTRLSIHASSHGKVMLAYLDERDREAMLDRLEWTRFTERTITTKEAMRAELGRIRTRGYSLDLAEGGEGVRCVSAPILNRQGVAVAALTTTGPAFRMPDRQLGEMGRCVKAHADRISMRLGYGLI